MDSILITDDDSTEFTTRWENVMMKIENDPELLELYEQELDRLQLEEENEKIDDDDLYPVRNYNYLYAFHDIQNYIRLPNTYIEHWGTDISIG